MSDGGVYSDHQAPSTSRPAWRLVSVAMERIPGLVTRPVHLDRIVYATITLMSVLIIYDGNTFVSST